MRTPENQIEQRIHSLGEWFQNLNLSGVQTAPNHFLGNYPEVKWRRFSEQVPMDLRGKSVLDIGCNAGFYSFEMKRRGADRVVGIDNDEGYLEQARFASKVLGLEVEFRNLSVYDVHLLKERFDLVLFLGVIYHLRHPLLALDLIYEHVTSDLLIFQSMLRGSERSPNLSPNYPFSEKEVFKQEEFPKLHFVEESYAGDPTNWWVPNRACAEGMLRSAGFVILSHPEEEVFICKRKEPKGVAHG